MADIVTRQCDMCSEPGQIRVIITVDDRRPFQIDLCAVHAAPIRDYKQAGRTPESGRKTPKTFQKITYSESTPKTTKKPPRSEDQGG